MIINYVLDINYFQEDVSNVNLVIIFIIMIIYVKNYQKIVNHLIIKENV